MTPERRVVSAEFTKPAGSITFQAAKGSCGAIMGSPYWTLTLVCRHVVYHHVRHRETGARHCSKAEARPHPLTARCAECEGRGPAPSPASSTKLLGGQD